MSATIKILEVTKDARNGKVGFEPTLNVCAEVDGVKAGFHAIPVSLSEFERLQDKSKGDARDYLFRVVEDYAREKQRADELAREETRPGIEAVEAGEIVEGFTGSRQAEDEGLSIATPASAPVTVKAEVTGTPTGASEVGEPTNPALPEKRTK